MRYNYLTGIGIIFFSDHIFGCVNDYGAYPKDEHNSSRNNFLLQLIYIFQKFSFNTSELVKTACISVMRISLIDNFWKINGSTNTTKNKIYH